MSQPLIMGRVCVRKPQSQEEWLELIQKLEASELDDLPVSAAVRLCRTLNISPEEFFALFDENSTA